MYSGVHRTQVDVSSGFKLVPPDFEVIQNVSSITIRWQHVAACVAGYILFAELETPQRSEILAPEFFVPDFDASVSFEFSGNLLKQCRNYSVSIAPILNTTELDVSDDINVVAFEASIFYFNEPASPDDVVVIEKTSNQGSTQ